jgi:hypothetical protein
MKRKNLSQEKDIPEKLDSEVKKSWERFVEFLSQEEKEELCLAVSDDALNNAQQLLDCIFPLEFYTLYRLADGFKKDAFLLRDDYRILPLEDMVAESIKKPLVVTDEMSGEFENPDTVVRLIFAVTKEENRDIQQVSLYLHEDGASVETWFKEGGIHDFDEVIDTELSLVDWLEECLEYYE